VRAISPGGTVFFGIDDENHLYWDGQRLEFTTPLINLTRREKVIGLIIALVAAAGAFLQGVMALIAYLCPPHP
jgi:hypothetical protein